MPLNERFAVAGHIPRFSLHSGIGKRLEEVSSSRQAALSVSADAIREQSGDLLLYYLVAIGRLIHDGIIDHRQVGGGLSRKSPENGIKYNATLGIDESPQNSDRETSEVAS